MTLPQTLPPGTTVAVVCELYADHYLIALYHVLSNGCYAWDSLFGPDGTVESTFTTRIQAEDYIRSKKWILQNKLLHGLPAKTADVVIGNLKVLE